MAHGNLWNIGSPSLFLASDISDYPDDELRANTSIINAYIHREMARILYKAEEKIRPTFPIARHTMF